MNNAVVLANICYRRAEQLYEKAVPDEVAERLEEELYLISAYHYEGIFLIAHRLVRNARRVDCPIGCRGMGASSLAAYLTRISDLNPMQLGIAVPLGLFEKLLEQKKWGFAFAVPEAYYQQAQKDLIEMAGAGEVTKTDMVTHYYEKMSIVPTVLARGGIMRKIHGADRRHEKMSIDPSDTGKCPYLELLKDNSPIMLFALQYETDISAESIPLNGGELLQLIKQDDAKGIPLCHSPLLREILAQRMPHDFGDWVKVAGMLHETNGIYKGNAETLLREGIADWSEIIVHREELFSDLTAHGMDETLAYQIMDSVRLGRVARGKEKRWTDWKRKMAECRLPSWYITSCEKIQYLFPKAHSAGDAYTAICLAWFKIHRPQVYRKFADEWLT